MNWKVCFWHERGGWTLYDWYATKKEAQKVASFLKSQGNNAIVSGPYKRAS